MTLRKIRLTPNYLRDNLDEVLEAVRQEDIPRVVCEGRDGPEVAAIVNAASLDRLIQAAEEAAEMRREPLRERYARHMAQWQEERRVLLEQLELRAMEIAKAACPKCRRMIRERYGDGSKETLGDVWKHLSQARGAEVIVSSTATDGAGDGVE